jgi:hypothetical protein
MNLGQSRLFRGDFPVDRNPPNWWSRRKVAFLFLSTNPIYFYQYIWFFRNQQTICFSKQQREILRKRPKQAALFGH